MRYTYSILIFVFLISICSCSNFSKSSDQNNGESGSVEEIVDFDLDKIKERGKLIAFVDNSSTSYFILRGKPMGYEYDLLKRFTDDIGVELEIKILSNINESFDKLNSGEGDLIAHFLTVTKERKNRISFTNTLVTTNQVLVQRKPENWEKMHPNTVDRKLIRNQVDLIGKEITVRQNSSYVTRLNNLSEEMGGDIIVVESPSNEDTEELIEKVANGELEYTVADKDIAMVNAAYYPILDVQTPLSFPQQIAWGVRQNSVGLQNELNTWIDESKKSGLLNILYNKYFVVTRTLIDRAKSEYASISGSTISEFDPLFKKYSQKIGWDWKLLAALAYQESRFRPSIKSWAGAIGLMQVMPRTGKEFGANDLTKPEQNVKAGTGFIHYLDKEWKKSISDSTERAKFILASYNAGYGHVMDAYRLAGDLGYDQNIWDDEVEKAMLLKSKPEYFNRESVKYGYCRGNSVVAYVSEILDRYEKYKLFYQDELAIK